MKNEEQQTLSETPGFAKETGKQSSTSGLEQAKEKMKDNKEMYEKVEIKDTPFFAVRENEDWWLILGRYRLNETPAKTREEIEEIVDNPTWFRYLQVMRIIAEDVLQEHLAKAKEEMLNLQRREDITSAKPMLESLERIKKMTE